jgi:hypothetical protein
MKYLILLITAWLSASCKSSDSPAESAARRDISGQIFTIRRDRVNVKLGGVDVYYLSGKTLHDRIEWLGTNLDRMRHLRRYCEELAGIDTWIGAISRERRGSAVFDKFVSDTEGLTAESYRRLESNPLVDSLMRIENFRQANHELFVGTDFEKAMDDQWVLSSLFFDWLEKNSYTSAQTNADGCFKMRIPESTRGFLFARASRALASDSEEHYYWIHEVDGEEGPEIMLTSSSILTRESLDGVLGLAAMTKRSSSDLIQDEFSLIATNWADDCNFTLRDITTCENKIAAINERIKGLNQQVEQVRQQSDF